MTSALRELLAEQSIPVWVAWLAQDSDGVWWGYEVEPLENHRGWYENEVGQYVRLGVTPVEGAWRQAIYRYPFQ